MYKIYRTIRGSEKYICDCGNLEAVEEYLRSATFYLFSNIQLNFESNIANFGHNNEYKIIKK